MLFVVPVVITKWVDFSCGKVMFMLCFLLGLSLGVAIGVSATSCGHPMATTSGHSMATSTGDLLKSFLHEMLFVFPLIVICVDFPCGNVLFIVCFLLALSLEVASGVSTGGGHWDAPEGYHSELFHKGSHEERSTRKRTYQRKAKEN